MTPARVGFQPSPEHVVDFGIHCRKTPSGVLDEAWLRNTKCPKWTCSTAGERLLHCLSLRLDRFTFSAVNQVNLAPTGSRVVSELARVRRDSLGVVSLLVRSPGRPGLDNLYSVDVHALMPMSDGWLVRPLRSEIERFPFFHSPYRMPDCFLSDPAEQGAS